VPQATRPFGEVQKDSQSLKATVASCSEAQRSSMSDCRSHWGSAQPSKARLASPIGPVSNQ